MTQPTHLDLFSGIGGFALAAGWAGFKTIGFSEIDPYASAVLKKHWPDVPNYGDVRTVPTIRCDLITGGFPCQPFSCSGKRQGKADDRYLWPAMLEVIDRCRPTFIVAENVPGIISMEFYDMLSQLEDRGYANWRTPNGRKRIVPLEIPACASGAAHVRDRVWIVADRKGLFVEESEMVCEAWSISKSGEPSIGLPNDLWLPDKQTYLSEMVGEIHGIQNWVDRSKGLGNSIVPQVAFQILKAIRTLI